MIFQTSPRMILILPSTMSSPLMLTIFALNAKEKTIPFINHYSMAVATEKDW